jgi:hypothetical protein
VKRSKVMFAAFTAMPPVYPRLNRSGWTASA